MRRRLVWWLFDRSPERFQRWVESWARTLIVRRAPGYRQAINWARASAATSTASTIPGAKVIYKVQD